MKLSVCIITYNHENYISQAIESVLMQKTNFDFEIVIGEDDSNDKTRDIVKEFRKMYPERITLILNDRKNVIFIDDKPTGRYNFANTLKSAKGKYVAILEGDDFWTDINKLQKQVDFLDNNPDYVMCFHKIAWYDQNRKKIIGNGRVSSQTRETYSLNDLLESNFIPTCSIVFRNNLFEELPKWFFTVPIGDHPFLVLLALKGKLGFINETLGVYRRHSESIFGVDTIEDNLQKSIKTYNIFSKELSINNKHYKIGLAQFYLDLYKIRYYKKKYWESTKAICLAIKYSPGVLCKINKIRKIFEKDEWILKLIN